MKSAPANSPQSTAAATAAESAVDSRVPEDGPSASNLALVVAKETPGAAIVATRAAADDHDEPQHAAGAESAGNHDDDDDVGAGWLNIIDFHFSLVALSPPGSSQCLLCFRVSFPFCILKLAVHCRKSRRRPLGSRRWRIVAFRRFTSMPSSRPEVD